MEAQTQQCSLQEQITVTNPTGKSTVETHGLEQTYPPSVAADCYSVDCGYLGHAWKVCYCSSGGGGGQRRLCFTPLITPLLTLSVPFVACLQASSPGALGPAAGRTSVYEQRAKILFELGRAQARAAAQCSTAAQVGGLTVVCSTSLLFPHTMTLLLRTLDFCSSFCVANDSHMNLQS